MSDYKLIVATKEDLQEIITWFRSFEELLQWGGPGLEPGVPLEEFAQQIRFTEVHSYCLLEGKKLCGFGQFYKRLGRHHFGRLAISPKERGKGLARILLGQLMALAPHQQIAEGFSLFVLEYNIPAVKAYQGLGFGFSEYPDIIPGGLENCRYMILDNYKEGSRVR